MATQNDNLMVKLLKKSVGLPTGTSSCCGTASEAAAPTVATGSAVTESNGASTCGCSSQLCAPDMPADLPPEANHS